MPPSTTRVWPLMKLAMSDTRNTSGLAISSATPARPSGRAVGLRVGVGVHALGGVGGRHARRVDHVGRDTVDADAVLPPLVGHRAHEVHEPGLGRAVRRVVRRAVEAAHRRDDGDATAAPLLDHAAARRARHVEVLREVAAQVELPVVVGHVDDRAPARGADHVDQHLEPAERVGRAVDDGLAVLALGDVAGERGGLHAERLDLGLHAPGRARGRGRRPRRRRRPAPGSARSRGRCRIPRPRRARACRAVPAGRSGAARSLLVPPEVAVGQS